MHLCVPQMHTQSLSCYDVSFSNNFSVPIFYLKIPYAIRTKRPNKLYFYHIIITLYQQYIQVSDACFLLRKAPPHLSKSLNASFIASLLIRAQ